MNKIKSTILDQTNWLEVTWVNVTDEVETVIHCESFGDSDEYKELLKQRCIELNTEVTEELENKLKEQESKRYIPTDEELMKIAKQKKISEINTQIAEAKAYLVDTGWIWEKYNRNVLVLKDITNEEFSLKYSEVISKQEEARVLINNLEAELETLK